MKHSRKRKIWDDEDMALQLVSHPPAQRSEREISRLQSILDQIEITDREPLAIELLVSCDARGIKQKGGNNE